MSCTMKFGKNPPACLAEGNKVKIRDCQQKRWQKKQK